MITTLGELDQSLRERGVKEAIGRLGKIYLILSGKGGVGKTTLAVNLAWAKVMAGHRVGLLDVDLHGPDLAAALYCDAKLEVDEGGRLVPASPRKNLWVLTLQHLLERGNEAVMWRGPRKMRAIIQFIGETAWPELDYFFIDSPPGTGDETLTVLKRMPEARPLVVSAGQQMALSDVAKAIDCLSVCGVKPYGLIDNLSALICPGCGELVEIGDKNATRLLAEKLGLPFLASLPMDPAAAKAADSAQKPLVEAAPSSGLAKAILDLAESL
jgi:Mrp family chromosome partitioning ATPase